MLTNEGNACDFIRQNYGPWFDYAASALAAGESVLSSAAAAFSIGTLDRHAASIALGLLGRQVAVLRSVSLLCEHGRVSEAKILTRGMLEGLINVKFILGIKSQIAFSTELQDVLDGLPPLTDAKVRAYLYVASGAHTGNRVALATKRHEQMRGVLSPEHMDETAAFLDDVDLGVGPLWAPIVRKRRGQVFKVKQLAEYVGITDHYETIYALESEPTHAGNALDFIRERYDDEGYTIDLYPDVDMIPEVLRQAIGYLIEMAATFITALDLEPSEDWERLGEIDAALMNTINGA